MADDPEKVRRFLHVRFKMPTADSTKILPIVKAAIPAYEGMIGGRVRLFRNVDDPSQFVQVIEYETARDFELNRQKLAGDPRIQTYLQGWRALFPGTFEIDVFEDVADSE
jgi:hypothetical protein